jgi:hypothetical protein
LSSNAVRQLSDFVTTSLLQDLQSRDDIDPKTAEALSATVRERLEDEEDSGSEESESQALDMFADGTLDEKAIGAALNKGDRGFAVSQIRPIETDHPEGRVHGQRQGDCLAGLEIRTIHETG